MLEVYEIKKERYFIEGEFTSLMVYFLDLQSAVTEMNNMNKTYSLSHKTVNTREYFWNVYCFATNQMRDETAEDNGQTAAGISHNLIRNNQLVLSSMRNLQFSLWISLKKPFYHKPTLVT